MALKISSIALACNHSQNFDSLIYLTKTMAQKFDASIHIFLYEGTKIDLSGKLDGINFKIESLLAAFKSAMIISCSLFSYAVSRVEKEFLIFVIKYSKSCRVFYCLTPNFSIC